MYRLLGEELKRYTVAVVAAKRHDNPSDSIYVKNTYKHKMIFSIDMKPLGWTEEEDSTLKKMYPLYLNRKTTKKELMDEIPNRTWTAIISRTAKIGIRGTRFKDGVLRKCYICGLEAKNDDELENFAKDSRYKHRRKNLCRPCANEYTVSVREKNPFHYLFLNKKCEAKRKKIPFDLDGHYLEGLWKKQGGCCALSGLKMFTPYRGDDFDLAGSIDRINPHGGYVKGNIRWVLNCVNTFKGQKDDDFVYEVSKAIIEFHMRKKVINQ